VEWKPHWIGVLCALINDPAASCCLTMLKIAWPFNKRPRATAAAQKTKSASVFRPSTSAVTSPQHKADIFHAPKALYVLVSAVRKREMRSSQEINCKKPQWNVRTCTATRDIHTAQLLLLQLCNFGPGTHTNNACESTALAFTPVGNLLKCKLRALIVLLAPLIER